ncbi:MAG TPA: patatin-like phospholipase family protein [Candidatus Binatus sp.]|nr:patatin-like phospholipase family protein [Candidatus Binatus sp.]
MPKRQKRVFILGGGAALGAHHVGALRFLEEQGIVPDAIIGSSIGVINACVYASGGVAELETAWKTFSSIPRIVSPSFRHNPLIGLSLFSMDRLTSAIEPHIDFRRIHESPLELEFVLLNLSRGRGEVHGKRECADWRELRTVSRAGYAIPILFPPVQFRGDLFVDGGFAWNIPLDRAIDLGATEIYLLAPIASQLPYHARFRTFAGFIQRFLDVMWRTIGNTGYLYARIEEGRFHGVPVTVIEPGEQWSGFGPLAIFSAHPRKNQNLMAAGYRDAKRALAHRRRMEASSRGTRRRTPRPASEPPGDEGADDQQKVVSLHGSDGKDDQQ